MPEVKVPRKSDLLLKEDPENLSVLLEEVAENLNLVSVQLLVVESNISY